MTVWLTTFLGILFLFLAIASTFLMFKLWGYPFDKETRTSEAPKWAMGLHRGIGYAYALIYIILMVKMIPRLWLYQVEFAPRTVAHIMLGFTIGTILIIKISIIRWFRHFEEWMPTLGVGLLVCTVLLIGLSVPNVLKERALASSGPGGSAFSAENSERVEKLLSKIDLPEEPSAKELASKEWLLAGREVLLDECVSCHDVKTAISKPRGPADWLRLVYRMQAKPTLGPVLDDREALAVTAYLVAITPDLQRSAKEIRQEKEEKQETKEALEAQPKAAVNLEEGKALFEDVCAQCHDLSDATDAPPTDAADLDGIIERMVDNGMDASAEDIAKIRAYMTATYLK